VTELADRLRKLIFQPVGIHRHTVDRPAALELPSGGERTGIHCIEAELVIEPCDDCLVGGVVAGQREAQAFGRSSILFEVKHEDLLVAPALQLLQVFRAATAKCAVVVAEVSPSNLPWLPLVDKGRVRFRTALVLTP